MKDKKTNDNQKTSRRTHALVVLVIFQSLLIVALLIAIIYKFIDISLSL